MHWKGKNINQTYSCNNGRPACSQLPAKSKRSPLLGPMSKMTEEFKTLMYTNKQAHRHKCTHTYTHTHTHTHTHLSTCTTDKRNQALQRFFHQEAQRVLHHKLCLGQELFELGELVAVGKGMRVMDKRNYRSWKGVM